MTEQKHIEEMAKTTMKHCEIDNQCGSCHWSTCNECLSEVLYNAGYRKQSEGKWIFEHESYGKMLCSNCKEEALVNDCNEYVDSDFCPNCGARMTGGKEW